MKKEETNQLNKKYHDLAKDEIAKIVEELLADASQQEQSNTIQALTMAQECLYKEIEQGAALLANHPHFASIIPSKSAMIKALQSLDQESTDTLQERLALSDLQMEEFYNFAVELYNNQDYKKAKSIFYTLCILNPSITGFWSALGNSAEIEHLYFEALSSYLRAYHLCDDPNYLLESARCLKKMDLSADGDHLIELALQQSNQSEKSVDFFSKAEQIRGIVATPDHLHI